MNFQKIHSQVKRKSRFFSIRVHRWLWGYPWTRLYLKEADILFEQLDEYYNTHPRLKLATKIAGPPLALIFLLFFIVWIETPGNRELRNIQNQVASEIYSADSVLLGRYYLQDRTEVKFEGIAPAVIDALIATEDVRFYNHSGVDYKSLGRVLVKSILQRDESSGGGSTLTQQLAKNLYPRRGYWIFPMLLNKIREVRIGIKLEDIYSKKELLTLYLNTVPFADNVFGIQAAADRFFSKPASELTVDQAALLVGMLKATHSYNPRLFPDKALKRRNIVLSRMVRYKKLQPAMADSIKALPVKLNYHKISHHQGLAPYFREYLKAELLEWCNNNEKEDGSSYNLYTDGLKIFTTIDSKLQHYAEKAVVQQMTEIQKVFFDHWGNQKPWKGKEEVLDQAIQRSHRYQQLKEKGLAEEDILQELQKPVPMTLFTWQGDKKAIVSPIDSIIHHLQYLNAGFLAVEPLTGKVKAWVGGIDHDFFQFDHVKTTTKRQVGSIFKPIVYAMAIERGAKPCDLISAKKQTYVDEEGVLWTPRNSQNDYEVVYSMKGALTYSVNTVTVKLIDKAGVANIVSLAQKMGINSEMREVPSIALGSANISLLEMTAVYSCFANEGVTSAPYFIKTIEDLDGKIYDNFKSTTAGVRVMKKETAQLMTNMLRTVVHEGTASNLRSKYGVYTDLAGKTGTTQSNADGWFMGVTPGLVIGTWVGADDPRIRFRSTELGQGSNTALPIAAYFLQQVNKDPHYKRLSEAKFPSLSEDLLEKLDCDLYELSDSLILKIEHFKDIRKNFRRKISRAWVKRHSTLRTDTLPFSYLHMLYERKVKKLKASQQLDSLKMLELDVSEGIN